MDEVEEIRRKIDIVDLISGYLTVKKAGANFRCLCPFHQEKTPSMMISPEKQIFKCFGCGEGGSVFDFVMKMENLEFKEALEILADRAGVKLETKKPLAPGEKPGVKSRLFALNAFASLVFQKILLEHPSGKVALDYLKNRGLTEQTIKDFQIGYAPAGHAVLNLFKKKSFSDQEIRDAGNPDRFFRRIIFPIRDVMGNTLGFTGRTIDKGQEPKYLNTPETVIFHKGRILYNLDKARGEIKLAKATVIVEGQMDVISSYQAGVKNVVASSGTALTPDHLQILYRYTPNIVFAFDSDTAGLTTAKKAYEMAITQGMNAKMVNTLPFKDPGEMIEKDPSLWQEAVKSAKLVIDWYFQTAFREKGVVDSKEEITPQNKKEIAKELLPIIKKIPDTIEQAHYVEKLSLSLGVPDNIIFEALEKNESKEVKNKPPEKIIRSILTPSEIIIGFIFNNPSRIGIIENFVGSVDFSEPYDLLYTEALNWYNKSSQEDFHQIIEKKIGNEGLKKVELIGMEVESQFKEENIDQAITDIAKNIKAQRKEKIKQKYAKAIQAAESAGNLEELKKLMKEFQDAITR